VLELPHRHKWLQDKMAEEPSAKLGFEFVPSDVFILATATPDQQTPMANYLRRAGRL
jgi:hypothetical protein